MSGCSRWNSSVSSWMSGIGGLATIATVTVPAPVPPPAPAHVQPPSPRTPSSVSASAQRISPPSRSYERFGAHSSSMFAQEPGSCQIERRDAHMSSRRETAGPAELVLTATVARRYYLDGATKSDIAAELGLSRFKVARMLDWARATGLVRIELETRGEINLDLSVRLRAAHGVRRGAADRRALVAGRRQLDRARARPGAQVERAGILLLRADGAARRGDRPGAAHAARRRARDRALPRRDQGGYRSRRVAAGPLDGRGCAERAGATRDLRPRRARRALG